MALSSAGVGNAGRGFKESHSEPEGGGKVHYSLSSLKFYVVNMASQYYQEMQESFKNNNKSREFPAHTAKVHSVAWSCDGRRVASGSFDKTASVFVLEKDRLVSLLAC